MNYIICEKDYKVKKTKVTTTSSTTQQSLNDNSNYYLLRTYTMCHTLCQVLYRRYLTVLSFHSGVN